jgi:hypothetical protein
MGKTFKITESEKKRIQKMYLIEDSDGNDNRKFCHSRNVKTLEEIVGDNDFGDYIDGIQVRNNGVNGLVDRIELLKTSRLHPKISDGGEHLAYEIMNTLKSYKPYNYFDETKKECCNAMDKIIELYKEDHHGEELVKDIEKIYSMQHHSQRTKEFLKHSLGIIKNAR